MVGAGEVEERCLVLAAGLETGAHRGWPRWRRRAAQLAAGGVCASREKQRPPYRGALRLKQGKDRGRQHRQGQYGGGQAGRRVLPACACLGTRARAARVSGTALGVPLSNGETLT
jgi:hypothetical protein